MVLAGRSKLRVSKNFFWGTSFFVFVEYLCKRNPKIKTKNIQNYSSILAIVNHRNWLDDSPPLIVTRSLWSPASAGRRTMLLGFSILIANSVASANVVTLVTWVKYCCIHIQFINCRLFTKLWNAIPVDIKQYPYHKFVKFYKNFLIHKYQNL